MGGVGGRLGLGECECKRLLICVFLFCTLLYAVMRSSSQGPPTKYILNSFLIVRKFLFRDHRRNNSTYLCYIYGANYPQIVPRYICLNSLNI